MLIIIDKRIPGDAKEKLMEICLLYSKKIELVELETEGIVHPAFSGHPDIFFCKTPGVLVVSPSLSTFYFNYLSDRKIPYKKGIHLSGIRHPASVYYTAAVSDEVLVHHLEYTDPVILENCHWLKKIDVKQGYTSCSLLHLKEGRYITSDHGIHKSLEQKGLKGIFVAPDDILLPGIKNGQIGGAMGIYKESVFVTGNLDHFMEGERIRKFLQKLNYNIVELHNRPLTDRGGILFFETE